MSELIVDIEDLVRNPGHTRTIRIERPVEGLKGGLAEVEQTQPIGMDLVAEGTREGIEVTGQVSGVMRLVCSRCLTEYDERFDQRVEEIYYFNARQDEEGYEVQGQTIDLEPMVRDAVVLSMPITPLHDPDCKGLCPRCGADRNLTDCGHDAPEPDLRWAPLAAMLKDVVNPTPDPSSPHPYQKEN